MKEVTSLWAVESSSRDLNSEPLRRGPRARAARRSCGPPDSTDGVLGKRTGFSGAISALAHGVQGSREGQEQAEEEEAPGTRIRRTDRNTNTTFQEQESDHQPTNQRLSQAHQPTNGYSSRSFLFLPRAGGGIRSEVTRLRIGRGASGDRCPPLI